MKANAAAFLGLLLCCSIPAQGALYEFTLKGTVTGGAVTIVGVNVGDEFIITYVLDSTDLNPDPGIGIYVGTGAVVEFPNVTLVGNPAGSPNLTVKATRPGLPDLAYYQTYPDILDPGYGVQISFAFPPGTLSSNALPLSLPLAQATTRYFELYTIHFPPLVAGTITSYESVLVPEPGAVSLLLLAFAGACARIRRPRH